MYCCYGRGGAMGFVAPPKANNLNLSIFDQNNIILCYCKLFSKLVPPPNYAEVKSLSSLFEFLSGINSSGHFLSFS